ncbi:MAG: FAD-dependent oxidoreductase [Xanthomonadaceae bacterium]|nr:FAD-dependent oxidoreductase [Xanthomonadaceae bacterium]
MSSPVSDDVLILGGGVIGLACAHYLLKAGRSVRVLEQGTPGCASSHGNCGTITPSHAPPLAGPGMIAQGLRWMLRPDAPLYIRPRFDPTLWAWLLRFAARCNRRDWRRVTTIRAELLNASRQLIAELVADNAMDCEFSASGMLYVFKTPAALEHFQHEHAGLPELGIDWQAWDRQTLAAEEPAMRDGLAGAVLFPGDARLRPDRYVAELARAVREAGGIIEPHCRVTGFETAAGRVAAVLTERGPRRAGEVVFALGAWSPMLGKSLGLRLPIQPGKGYSITYSKPERAPIRPMVLKERSVCVTSWESGFRLGSTMEFSGYDSRLNPTRLRALIRGAGEYLHQPEGPMHVEDWYGWRPMTWDDLPIIGRAPGLANLTLATGHGMLGVTLSAVTGHLVADGITGRSPVVDQAPYSPARFG